MSIAVNLPNVIALHESDIDKQAVGRIVFWALNGSVSLERLTQSLLNVGSSAHPPDAPTATVALHRAVEAIADRFRLDVHGKDKGVWTIVNSKKIEESQGASKKVTYDVALQASLELGSLRVECFAGFPETPDGTDITAELHAEFNKAKGELSSTDVSVWLTSKVKGLAGLALRESGGFYFIPKGKTRNWSAMAYALKQCSKHHLHEIPALRSKDAVDAIMAAITAETKAACDKIEAEIADAEIGPRALKTRQEEVSALLEKVSGYEELLGEKLEQLRAQAETTRSAVAAAIMMSADAS
jgi:hypothetical protein